MTEDIRDVAKNLLVAIDDNNDMCAVPAGMGIDPPQTSSRIKSADMRFGEMV